MKTYPRLTEMGVLHPEQISRFSVNSLDYNDFLRIVYERPKGSLLPISRTYRFPRIQKTLEKDDQGRQQQVVMESNPKLHEILDELHEIVGAKSAKHDIAQTLLDELHCMEEDFASHCEDLKKLIEEIKKV